MRIHFEFEGEGGWCGLAAFKLMEGRADVLISTLSFALGEVNTGSVTVAGEAVGSLEKLGIPVVQAIACQDAAMGLGRGRGED